MDVTFRMAHSSGMIGHKRQMYLKSAQDCRDHAAQCDVPAKRKEWLRLAREWEIRAVKLLEKPDRS